jgi:SAM-dependent methyltransferase
MHTLSRIVSERVFHDEQSADRARSFRSGQASLVFRDADWLDHETWIRPAVARLGALWGRRVLDLGCGHGMAAVVLARQGAIVSAVDLSLGYVAEARQRAKANRVSVDVRVAEGESLPFSDQSFDAIWGNAILHHLDLNRAAAEVRRVLKPGGVAVFCEPWDGNALLRFARRCLPYPGKLRTADERPLQPRDRARLRAAFPGVRLEGFQLFAMLRRVHPIFRRLDAMDRFLFRVCPSLRNLGRYVVLTFENV